jgi:hypothetical protein
MMIVWYLGCRITPWMVGRFLAALLADAAFVVFVVVVLMFVFSQKKSLPRRGAQTPSSARSGAD